MYCINVFVCVYFDLRRVGKRGLEFFWFGEKGVCFFIYGGWRKEKFIYLCSFFLDIMVFGFGFILKLGGDFFLVFCYGKF